MKEISDTVDLYIKDMSPEIKAGFKAWAARRQKTLKDAIEEVMLEKVREDFPQE